LLWGIAEHRILLLFLYRAARVTGKDGPSAAEDSRIGTALASPRDWSPEAIAGVCDRFGGRDVSTECLSGAKDREQLVLEDVTLVEVEGNQIFLTTLFESHKASEKLGE
jgi:predicted RNA-binding protein